jgi:hypothetical protein
MMFFLTGRTMMLVNFFFFDLMMLVNFSDVAYNAETYNADPMARSQERNPALT